MGWVVVGRICAHALALGVQLGGEAGPAVGAEDGAVAAVADRWRAGGGGVGGVEGEGAG